MSNSHNDERIEALIRSGNHTWSSLAQCLGVARSTVRSWFPDAKTPLDIISTPHTEFDGLLQQLRQKEVVDFYALCDNLDLTPSAVHALIHTAREAGIPVVFEEYNQTVYLPNTPTRFAEPVTPLPRAEHIAVISDLHFGSKYCQITALHDFITRAVDAGVEYVFVAGDVTAGYNVYPGQIHDVYAIGCDEQVESVANNLPVHAGLHYYMIGGNHDYSHFKAAGVDVVESLARVRDDVTNLGFDQQDVSIGEWTIRLVHPSGGAPYARSYRAQKLAESAMVGELWNLVHIAADAAISTSTVPMLLVWGHLHYASVTPYGPIFTLGPGCFEGQTNYLARKGLQPTIGGFIVDIPEHMDEDVTGVTYRHISYHEIPDDYQQYVQVTKRRLGVRIK